jgi:hypothetical protein
MTERPLLLALVACAACAAAEGPATDAGVARTIEPTYEAIEAKVFLASCATSSCHSSTGRAGGLDLSKDGWEALVGVEPKNAAAKAAGLKLVVPGKPEQSFLYVKVSQQGLAAGMGQRMPNVGDPLGADAVWAIETWIRNGATHPVNDCYPAPGTKGNELGVGAFCTAGMGECAEYGRNGANACAIDMDPEGSPMCIKVGCTSHDTCGAGACCYGRETGPRACIPKLCAGVAADAPCATF